MAKKQAAKRTDTSTEGKIRVSVGFSPEMHNILGKVAKEKKVSFGWVVRDAVEKYVADKWPLFAGK